MNVGDEVTWTKSSARGRTLSMRLMYGTVESIKDGIATVLRTDTVRKTRAQIPLRALTVRGRPTAIDRVMDAVRKQGKP